MIIGRELDEIYLTTLHSFNYFYGSNFFNSISVTEVSTIKNFQNTKLNLNKNYSFITSKMNSINLFPTEDKQTLKAEKLKFQFSFSSYSSYMTISSCDKELTIYLNDQSVRDQIIFNVNNLNSSYSRDKSFLVQLFKSVVTRINEADKEDRAELEQWLVANFKHQEVK